MKKRLVIFYCGLVVYILGLSGCMVGPDYERGKYIFDANAPFYNQGEHIADVCGIESTLRWWENFADPVTNELVEKAITNNYSVKAAAARVLQSEAVLEEAGGTMLPDISYSLGRDRNKSVFNFTGQQFSSLTTTYSQGVSVSYTLDLFGKLKHAERAAWNELLLSQADKQAVTNALIAAVINARINISTISRQMDIVLETTASRKRTLKTIERRYENGRVSSVDVRLARENLAAAQAVEPKVELNLAKAHYGLDVLLGRRPGGNERLADTLADIPDLGAVPVGMPAGLLDRRPDLIAAEAQLKSINDRVGISVAQLYPDLTLTGNYGGRSEKFGDVFKDDFEVYSLVAGITQPIWRGGQLRAQVKGSKARYEEAANNYAETVLNAFREVEEAIVSERQLKLEYQYQKIRFEQASKAEKLSLERYSQGLEPLLTFLESERRRINAENDLVLVKGAIWNNRVNLFLSLGGDWIETENSEQKTESRERI